VETRFLHKAAKDRWVMVAYRWRADQGDAEAVPAGELNALGTKHDIPDQTLCARCHASQELLGVSALQLSHDLPGQNLMSLGASGRLSKLPARAFKIPGGPTAENALGYLHANCGHCHQPGTAAHAQLLKRPPKTGGPILWERTDALDTLEHTVGYVSTVLQANSVLPDLHIVEPGYPDKSELVIRTGQRGVGTLQMPPVGTEVVDEAGLKLIKDWITSLKK
jgi:mono/diheme cytochrome c family protein